MAENTNASAPIADVTGPNEHDSITANAITTPISSQTASDASNSRHIGRR